MNDAQRHELQQIRDEHRALTERLAGLDARLRTLEAGLAAPVPAPVPPPPPPPSALAAAKLPRTPPPPEPAAISQTRAPLPPPLPAAAPAESLEVRIGTTWLVRVGVVLLLTSLAFAGSYLYKNVVPHLGPAAKVGLLYVGAGALTALGAWLEGGREAARSPRLLNYARVVFAGGLAAVYYVTYAAHWNPQLLVFRSPLLAGGLLLGWTACMAWLADRRDSEVLATFAVLLAYYASAINEIENFTLFSNLSLTVAAVVLLRRHLWKVFPFVSLLATFGSYAFWSYVHGVQAWGLPDPAARGAGPSFWVDAAFLFIYWALFTGTVFVPGTAGWGGGRRAAFVTANNAAFFLLTTWRLLGEYPGSFWKWSLGFGAMLCALAEAGRRLRQRLDRDAEGAYALQGVLLVTLGFVAYFSGWQLGLVLAVQSVALLGLARARGERLPLGLSAASALVAFVVTAHGLGDPGEAVSWAGVAATGALFVFDAWWCQRLLTSPARGDGDFREMLGPAPSFFSLLGAAAWLWLIERQLASDPALVPVLAGAAVLLTASVHLLRVRALPFYAQAYVVAAHFHQQAAWHWWDPPAGIVPWWQAVILLAATLAIGHWWTRRRAEPLAAPPAAAVDALFAVALLYAWLKPAPGGHADAWVAASAGLSLVLLGYGLLTRYRALAAVGQVFLAVSLLSCFGLWLQTDWPGNWEREPWLTLAPLAAIAVTLAAGARCVPADARQRVAWLYELAAVGLVLGWGMRYVAGTGRFAFFAGVGAAVFAAACLLGTERRWRWWSAVLGAAGVMTFLALHGDQRASFLHLLGVAVLAGQQRFGRWRLAAPARAALFPAAWQGTLMAAAALCAWAVLNARMAHAGGAGFTLAAAWSLYAALVFAAGLTLHEKTYRSLGLIILVCTLGRIAVVDIWQLDSLGRAVSALCLGTVLLGIGFLYNRFHARWHGLF